MASAIETRERLQRVNAATLIENGSVSAPHRNGGLDRAAWLNDPSGHGVYRHLPDVAAPFPEAVKQESVWTNGLDWPTVLWISFCHVGALGAFFFFTWKAVALF